MAYTPLYVLSEYSMLQSTCHIDQLVNRCKEYGLPALAVTDVGVMHGQLKLYNACQKAGIKFIFGLKVEYIVNNSTSWILLFAENYNGYRNLMRISSRYRVFNKPLEIEDLKKTNEGIIAVTCGMESNILRYLNNPNHVLTHLEIISGVFKELYIGISQNTQYEIKNLENFYNFFRSKGYDMVAISPTFYVDEADRDAYQVLRSVASGGRLVNLSEVEQNASLLKDNEIRALFRLHPDLVDNTNDIADKCNVEIEFGKLQIPLFKNDLDSKDYLRKLSQAGLKKRSLSIKNYNHEIYQNRLFYELNIISQMGFDDYFLIVYDYVKFAKKRGIYVGPGRGSAGASLVAYCLGITDIDPIKYNLLFERFLNPERITMPDIDVDFPDNERNEVIKYVGERYGNSKVAHICTFGTYQTKLVVADTGKVYKISDEHLKEVKRIINSELLKSKNEKPLPEIVETSTKLRELMEDFPDINKLITTAVKIYNLPKSLSTHTAGIIITRHNLVNYTALEKSPDEIFESQYEASDIESLGLLKMDFLSLRNLTTIASTIDLIRQNNPNFVMPKDENDPRVYRMLSAGYVNGVFQFESEGMRKLLMQLKPTRFEDLVSALALYRPGPMDMIPHFINRKFQKEKIDYPHPDLKDILSETYGIIIYQEQIMQIAQKFAGYTLGHADVLRRAVSKKKKEVLEAERTSFVSSSIKNGYSKEDAEKIYDYIVKFADYGFNKAHSVAYSKLSYQTAYLKCYYPQYYLSTLFTSVIGSESDIQAYYREATLFGIQVLGPDINRSTDHFLPTGKQIIFPLTSIRGLGTTKTAELLNERNKGPFTSFKDFIIRTKDIISLSVVSNIIYSGALDGFGLTKKAMIESGKKHLDLLDYEGLPGIFEVKYTSEEFSYGELTEREKEVIGINLKYNFFVQYSSIYQERGLIKIKDLKNGMHIHTLGVLKNVKIVSTKNNEKMAICKLEDDLTQIDMVIFPKVFNSISGLSVGVIIEAIGNVELNERNNNLQLIANEIRII